MRRLVHMSDLHFGRDRAELLDPLVRVVKALEPDLIIISGDLTQRARTRQFRAARALIDRFTNPVLVIPGNHDTPLDRPIRRLFDPWHGYRAWIGTTLEPQVHDDVMSVVGVNTVNPLVWQRGRIGRRGLKRIRAAFAAHPGPRVRIVVAHHPPEHAPGERKGTMRGAARALDAFAECGADVILSGHLHTWRAEPLARGGALSIQAGTGLSTRQRGEANDFNLLTLDHDTITVDRYAAAAGAAGFTPDIRRRFERTEGGWRACDD